MRRLPILFCFFFLAACGSTAAVHPKGHVISHASVTYTHESARLTREYEDEADILELMSILRSFVPAGDCAIPEYPWTDQVKITLFCANGIQHTYEVRDFSYLRRDGGMWQRLSIEDPSQMPRFLMLHLGDKTPKKAEPVS